MKCFRERLFASLVKKNLRLTFFICGTCSGVDRLKLPLKICQKSDSVCSVFEMTNVIVVKKEIRNFSCFCLEIGFSFKMSIKGSQTL